MTDCIFCRIAAGDVPADVVARTDNALAFRDVHPQAPVHILVIPTTHVASSAHVADPVAEVLGQIMALAVRVAADLGLERSGYRLVLNTGHDGGQTVDHLHVHLLGGRTMTWPPG
jgi:histidine triad (HIT) family protein